LTYPALNRSRRIVWLVTGGEKAEMLARLVKGDDSIPAGRIRRDQALVMVDREATGSEYFGGDDMGALYSEAPRRSGVAPRPPDSFTDAESSRR